MLYRHLELTANRPAAASIVEQAAVYSNTRQRVLFKIRSPLTRLRARLGTLSVGAALLTLLSTPHIAGLDLGSIIAPLDSVEFDADAQKRLTGDVDRAKGLLLQIKLPQTKGPSGPTISDQFYETAAPIQRHLAAEDAPSDLLDVVNKFVADNRATFDTSRTMCRRVVVQFSGRPRLLFGSDLQNTQFDELGRSLHLTHRQGHASLRHRAIQQIESFSQYAYKERVRFFFVPHWICRFLGGLSQCRPKNRKVQFSECSNRFPSCGGRANLSVAHLFGVNSARDSDGRRMNVATQRQAAACESMIRSLAAAGGDCEAVGVLFRRHMGSA